MPGPLGFEDRNISFIKKKNILKQVLLFDSAINII